MGVNQSSNHPIIHEIFGPENQSSNPCCHCFQGTTNLAASYQLPRQVRQWVGNGFGNIGLNRHNKQWIDSDRHYNYIHFFIAVLYGMDFSAQIFAIIRNQLCMCRTLKPIRPSEAASERRLSVTSGCSCLFHVVPCCSISASLIFRQYVLHCGMVGHDHVSCMRVRNCSRVMLST